VSKTYLYIVFCQKLKIGKKSFLSHFVSLVHAARYAWFSSDGLHMALSTNKMLRTLISLGKRLSAWLLTALHQSHLPSSLGVWTITLLYVISFQSHETDEIKLSYNLNSK